MAKKPRRRSEPDQANDRARRRMIVVGLVMVVGGLAATIASVGYRWHLSDKAERLRADGEQVTAEVTDFYQSAGRGGGADTIDLAYTYGGRRYSATILCGGGTGCAERPDHQMTVWVDREEPDEFVAANGHTDGSAFFLNSWTLPVAGVAFVLIGSVPFALIVVERRMRERRRQNGRAHGGRKKRAG